MKHVFLSALVFGATLVCAVATGEETSAKQVITIKPTTVVGSPRRPTVAIEVSKVPMKLGATTPTLAGSTRTQDAAKKDPF